METDSEILPIRVRNCFRGRRYCFVACTDLGTRTVSVHLRELLRAFLVVGNPVWIVVAAIRKKPSAFQKSVFTVLSGASWPIDFERRVVERGRVRLRALSRMACGNAGRTWITRRGMPECFSDWRGKIFVLEGIQGIRF